MSTSISKSCPYRDSEGCTYTSQSTSSATNDHNVGSHVSNVHRQMTRVWYGLTQVTIHRDNKTKLMTCPCGEYSHKNSSAVRRHAMTLHKGSAAATAPRSSRASDTDASLSVAISGKLSTSSKSASRAAEPRAAVARVEVLKKQRNEHTSDASEATLPESETLPKRRAEASSAASSTGSLAAPLVDDPQPPPELRSVGRKATGVLHPRVPATTSKDVLYKGVPKDSIAGPSTKVRRVDVDHSASVSKFPSSTKTSSTVSKPLAKKLKRLSVPVCAFTSSKLVATGAVSAPRATVPSKRIADDVPEAPPPKTPRVYRAQTAQQTRKINQPLFVKTPLPIRSFDPSLYGLPGATTPGFTASESISPRGQSRYDDYPRFHTDNTSSSSTPSNTASGSTLTSISPHHAFVTRSPKPPTAISIHGPEPRQVVCVSCGGRDSETGDECSICQSLAPEPNPKLERSLAQALCVSCGTNINGKWDKCTMCQMRALTRHEVPLSTQPPAEFTVSDAASAKPMPTAPKPRPLVTKKTRELFEQWFTNWKQVYHSYAFMSEPQTDQWRVVEVRGQRGTTYATAEAFLAAFRECLAEHRAGGAGGEVLQFYGAYSIVAHPRIGATARLAKLKAKLSEMGFELDGSKAGVCKFTYMHPDGKGVITIDDVYKYPCPCGGEIVPPQQFLRTAVRIPDAAFAGPCGGTVMLIVGDDDALKAYGTNGQWIAIDIVH